MHFIMCALLTSTFSLVSIIIIIIIIIISTKLSIMKLLCIIDTAFMFIIGGLLTVKVLQSRHPDLNALSYVAFFCFGVVVFMTLIGIVSHVKYNDCD